MFSFSFSYNRSYNKPNISQERLIQNIDTLRVSVLAKLNSKNRGSGNLILDFTHGCFRFLLHGKDRKAREKGYILLDEVDFERFRFLKKRDVVCDSNGDGVKVKYPFKVRLLLSKSPKTFSLINGELREDQ